MTNFKKQKRLCRTCRKVWFTPLYAAHWHHCVGPQPETFWDTWKREKSAQAENSKERDR